MHPVRLLLLALAAGALLVAGCGDDDASTGAANANRVDRGFIAEMVPHHEAAVAMAKTAQRRASSAFVKGLADDIIRSQTAEISTMRARDMQLAAAGVQRGSLNMSDAMMGMDHDAGSLETAKPFDAAFLGMMIPHHEGAVTMSKALLARGADPELKTLARSIIAAQQREIAQMRDHLGAGAGGAGMHEEESMPGHSG
jgi:uncharacterized protein (DUF305 family)